MISIDTRKGNWPQNHHPHITQLLRFRQELHANLTARENAIMNLIDALSSNTTAKSVAELSLNPVFNYQYTSVYDAIDQFCIANTNEKTKESRQQQTQLMNLLLGHLPEPVCRRFWLFCLDTTPAPRPYAWTLADRSIVYSPNPVGNNKPIAIGHQYASLVYLPEKFTACARAWVVPLCVERISSEQTAAQVQANQLTSLLKSDSLDWGNRFCVCVADSTLGSVGFLDAVQSPNLVTITRIRSNRVLYLLPDASAKKRGHPRWYGNRFDLKDQQTWPPASEEISMESTTRSGRQILIHLCSWHHLLMRGTRQHPMHNHPFSLVRVRVTTPDGKSVFNRPMWLSVMGERGHQLSLKEVYHAYRQRVDIEHFFRFGKQKLLTTAYQTPEVEHEQNWWQITQLAYVQLFLARHLAESLPRPWERYQSSYRTQLASPSLVQRDFGRIIRHIEPQVVLPKPRGKSPGRAKGAVQLRREKRKVIKKGKKRVKKAA